MLCARTQEDGTRFFAQVYTRRNSSDICIIATAVEKNPASIVVISLNAVFRMERNGGVLVVPLVDQKKRDHAHLSFESVRVFDAQ